MLSSERSRGAGCLKDLVNPFQRRERGRGERMDTERGGGGSGRTKDTCQRKKDVPFLPLSLFPSVLSFVVRGAREIFRRVRSSMYVVDRDCGTRDRLYKAMHFTASIAFFSNDVAMRRFVRS